MFLEDADIEKLSVSNKIAFCEKKVKNTLLVTCIMIIKLLIIKAITYNAS